MDKYFLLLIIAFIGCLFLLQYQIFSMVKIDAKARNLKSPTLFAFLSLSGQRGEGILSYIIYRKKYALNMSDEDNFKMKKTKNKIFILFFILIALAVILLFYIMTQI